MIFTKDTANNTYSAQLDAETALEIGDKTNKKFCPRFLIKKWNEAEISIALSNAASGTDETASQDILKWKNGKVRAEIYGINADAKHQAGALELSVIFDEKPISNIILFDIELKNAAAFKQPPLTAEIGQHGIITATETEGKDAAGNVIVRRPENVVNSYAFYHTAPINKAGGINYKAGKIAHLYRPKVTDANNKSVFCEIDIDELKKEMKITIPQSFLDSAVFPVILDPTAGYTTIGGTEVYFNAAGSLCHIGSGLIVSPTSGHNRITKFTAYGRGDHIHVAAYTIVAGLPAARLAAGIEIDLPAANAWQDSAAVAQTMTNGNTYGMAEGDASAAYLFFDTGTGNQRSAASTNLPATWSSTGTTAAMYSWYFTYEEVGSHFLGQ